MELLIAILIADVLNPVLLAFLIYVAGSPNGARDSLVGLLGHTFAYFCAGLILLWGFERVALLIEQPSAIDFVFSTLVGVFLLWAAYRTAQARGSSGADRTGSESAQPPGPARIFATGAVINFIGLPFALPYFAAVDQILKADLDGVGSVAILAAYNLAYAAPFALVPILTALMGERSRAMLQSINGWVERGSAVVMPLLLAAIGALLVADGISFFVRGKALI